MVDKQTDIVIYKQKGKAPTLEVRVAEDTVWLSQRQMSELFDKNVMTINEHIRNIYSERELSKKATIRKSLIVQQEG